MIEYVGMSKRKFKRHIVKVEYKEIPNIALFTRQKGVIRVPSLAEKSICGASTIDMTIPCKPEDVTCKRCLSIYENKIKPSLGGK